MPAGRSVRIGHAIGEGGGAGGGAGVAAPALHAITADASSTPAAIDGRRGAAGWGIADAPDRMMRTRR
jgi:hypothetical protein